MFAACKKLSPETLSLGYHCLPMHPAERHGVFISYAREDGEPFVSRLRDLLASNASEITVRWDRIELQGGEPWWQQICDSIEGSQYLILVLTPMALSREWVRREWLHARRHGVSVLPVKGGGDKELPISSLPSWMRDRHLYDLEHELPSFVQQLRTPSRELIVPFMAPEPPRPFVFRAIETDQLNSVILGGQRRMVTLCGGAGSGKTSLAKAFCAQPEIEEKFADGVLWVSLGPAPKLLDTITTLYAALTGVRPGFAGESDAAFHLSEALGHRRMLIVVDDVWDSAHLIPFLQGGPNSTTLITSTRSDLLADSPMITLDEMTDAEATTLLSVDGADPEQVQGICGRLGNWPLALELARAAIRTRIRFGSDYEQAVQETLEQLISCGVSWLRANTLDERHRSIKAAIDTSRRLLSTIDFGIEIAASTKFTELAIFPGNIPVSLSAVEALWGIDRFETEQLAQAIASLSLIKLDLRNRVFQIHPIIRSLLEREMIQPSALHSQIVDGWSDWFNLADSYAWRWLPWHLQQAQRAEDLSRILWSPRWLSVKLRATDPDALIADFDNLKGDPDAALVQTTLRLSAHVIARDPDQLLPQLAGRLLAAASNSIRIRELIQFDDSVSNLLKPVSPGLRPPGTSLIRTLVGHRFSVQGAAVLDDGKRAISASWDRTLIVWDLETGQALHTLTGHTYPVSAVAVYENGTKAVSSSADRTVKIWDLRNKTFKPLGAHVMAVSSVAVDPTGTRALSGSYDHTLKLWDLKTEKLIDHLVGHAFWINSVFFISGGTRAVSTSWDRTVRIWDLSKTGSRAETLMTLTGHQEAVLGASTYANETRLISASADHTLKIWDLNAGGVPIGTLRAHGGAVTSVATFAAGTRAISSSEDRTLKLWSLEAGDERPLRSLAGHGAKIISVTVYANGTRAISASQDRTLRIWDLETGETALDFRGHGQAINALAIDTEHQRAISASADWDLKVWDLGSASCLSTLSGHRREVTAVKIYARGARAISASKDGTLREWDLATGEVLKVLSGHTDAVTCVTIFPGERLAVSGSSDCTVRLWCLDSGNLVTKYFTDHALVTCEVDPVSGLILAGDVTGGLHFLQYWKPPGRKTVHAAI